MIKKLLFLFLAVGCMNVQAENSIKSLVAYQDRSSSSNKAETYNVYHDYYQGIYYHVANYSDGMILTTLSGPHYGLQCILQNGVVVHYSANLKQHNNYFSHKYPWGHVISYPNYQYLKK